jgi:predicted TIM-barrel fold metal-dependent hydrolase
MIDFHTHLGRTGKVRTATFEPAELVLKMDRWGIGQAVVLPLHDSPSGWYYATTETVLAACGQFPNRLIPFAQIDPRFGDNTATTDFSDLLAEYQERGCRGVGEITANMYFDDPLVINLLRQCGEAGLPVVVHAAHRIGGTYGLVDDLGLPRLERLLNAAPDTVFAAHGPAWWSEISADANDATRGGYPTGPVQAPGRVAQLLAKYPNLYGELSAGSGFKALTRDPEYGLKFLTEFQDKLLFGTDTLSRDMNEDQVPIVGFMQRILNDGQISAAAHAQITHRNAARLLGLE